MAFPRREQYYDRFLTFADATAEELAAWKSNFLWFLKKLTFKHRRPLLLKSPPHTGRIRLLLELFPDARFVHIHRHPYTLFQSLKSHHATAYGDTYLQRPETDGLEENLLARYNRVYDAFFAEKEAIPAGRFCEVAYEDLERDPIGQLRGVYEALSLPGFDRAEPRMRDYVASIGEYRKNRHRELDPTLRQQIARAWERSFDTWHYAA
jgi:hypothetical protein